MGLGKHRDSIPVAYWSPPADPEETAAHAEAGSKLGFRVHRIKVAPEDAVDHVSAVVEAAGKDYGIRLAPEQLFELPATMHRIDRSLREFESVECVEDPVPKQHPEWYGLLREKCAIPIALQSSDTRLILNHLRANGIDYLCVGGTIGSAIRAAALAEAAGCPVWLRFDGLNTDIGAAFTAHVGTAIPNATLPYDCAPFLRRGPITREGYGHDPRDGHLALPDGPGLGVTLDLDACETYRIE